MVIQRPLKEGNVRTYQEKVALGFPDILASEADADLDTIYAAWNGGVDTVNIKDGAVTNVKINDVAWSKVTGAPTSFPPSGSAGGDLSGTYPNPTVTAAAKSKWTDTGTVLTPTAAAYASKLTLDGAGNLTATGNMFAGAGTIKGHVYVTAGGDTALGTNNSFAPNDATKTSWFFYMSAAGDSVQLYRRPANSGAGVHSSYFVWDNAGNISIAGPTATKASGTTWANPSDGRLKKNITPYDTGLEAILTLNPIAFKYNGKGDTTADDRECWGLVAQDVLPVMPEMVTHRQGKLDPDDAEETDILGLDTSNVTLALINAVKELAARLTVLEARA